jgi:biopolymer transport protein ExbB
MRFWLPTIGIVMLLPVVAWGESTVTVDAAWRSASRSLEEAQAALAAQREQIAAERQPLLAEHAALQAEVKALRETWAEVQRAATLREAERDAARRRARAVDAEHRQTLALLMEFRRAVEEELSAAARQRVWTYLEDVDAGLASGSVAGAAQPTVTLLRMLLGNETGASVYTGRVLNAEGVWLDGELVSAGPMTWFRSADGAVSGVVGRDQTGLEPMLWVGLDRRDQRAVARWWEGRSTELPVDVSGGTLRALADAETSLWQRIRQGGVVMVPLLAIGLACVVMAVRRYRALRAMDRPVDADVDRMLAALRQGDAAAARQQAEALPEPWRPVFVDAVQHAGADRVYLEEILQDRVVLQAPLVQQYLGALAICAAAAPLLGLLGTVTGMIHTFDLITVFGTGDARSLSGGISEALITTQAGLMIAVPVLLAHAYLSRMARGVLTALDQAAIRFVRLLHADEAR